MDNTPKHSTAVVKTACAIVFLLFTFFYLYYFQADILAMAQHVLSHGKTHYNRTVGAVLITVVLYLLQMGVYAVTKLEWRAHALTYFPSLLVLTFLTSPGNRFLHDASLGAWLWAGPLVVLLYCGVVWVFRQLEDIITESGGTGLFSRLMWVNMLIMVVLFFMVAAFSNHDEEFHYRLNIESRLLGNDLDGALAVGEGTVVGNEAMTRLRAYALSKKGQLAERLFEYNVCGGSAAIIPQKGDTSSVAASVMFPQQELRKQYLRNKKDYELCGYLADKEIDKFAQTLIKYYPLNDSVHLPKHYREALTLYTRQRSHRVLDYRNSVMETDFADLLKLERENTDKRARKNAVHDNFRNTYWYYYLYR